MTKEEDEVEVDHGNVQDSGKLEHALGCEQVDEQADTEGLVVA